MGSEGILVVNKGRGGVRRHPCVEKGEGTGGEGIQSMCPCT